VIEVVPDTRSRDQIGKDMDESSNLLTYFRTVHGHPDSTDFQQVWALRMRGGAGGG
jgi:hypothetical protein